MTVRTYWAWKTTATLRLLGGARGAEAPAGRGEGRGHIVSPRAQLDIIKSFVEIRSQLLRYRTQRQTQRHRQTDRPTDRRHILYNLVVAIGVGAGGGWTGG